MLRVPCLAMAVVQLFLGLLTARGADIAPYRPGVRLAGTERYTAEEVISIPWGSEPWQVGQHRLDTRGALSYSPRYLSVAGDGTLYIGDEVNQRILCYDSEGMPLSCFEAAYGGYCMFVDDSGDLYTMFKRLFAPFTIAVWRAGQVIREIELGYMKRNTEGDRVWLDYQGGLHLNLVASYQPIVNLSDPVERPFVMENLVSGSSRQYSARWQRSEFGPVREGYLSRYFDRVYVLVEADLVVRTLAGMELSRLGVKQLVRDVIGIESGVSLDVARALLIFGEDRLGHVYLLARTRIKRPGTSAYTMVKLSSEGEIVFACDTFSTEIHYGSEVQFYPCSLAVDARGSIVQLCTDGETGVRLMRWSKQAAGAEK